MAAAQGHEMHAHICAGAVTFNCVPASCSAAQRRSQKLNMSSKAISRRNWQTSMRNAYTPVPMSLFSANQQLSMKDKPALRSTVDMRCGTRSQGSTKSTGCVHHASKGQQATSLRTDDQVQPEYVCAMRLLLETKVQLSKQGSQFAHLSASTAFYQSSATGW